MHLRSHSRGIKSEFRRGAETESRNRTKRLRTGSNRDSIATGFQTSGLRTHPNSEFIATLCIPAGGEALQGEDGGIIRLKIQSSTAVTHGPVIDVTRRCTSSVPAPPSTHYIIESKVEENRHKTSFPTLEH